MLTVQTLDKTRIFEDNGKIATFLDGNTRIIIFPMPKRSISWVSFIALIALAGGATFFFNRAKSSKIEDAAPKESPATLIDVLVRKASELKNSTSEERLPGVIVPDAETAITATTSGTVSSVSFNIGTPVAVGSTLLRIDTPFGAISKDGIQSDSVRQAEIAVSLAKKSYKEAKSLAEKEHTKSTTNTLARDLAKLRLESASIALANALDASIVRSTASGVVSQKNVGVGSSVVPGTVLATIASGASPKVRFHVSEDTRRMLTLGGAVTVASGGKDFEARVTSIGAVADANTGKFPVEATFKNTAIPAGTVATVTLQTNRAISSTSEFSLPLSAITTGQDGSFFFIVENGAAKKVGVESIMVSGETGIVSAAIPEDAVIVVESKGTLEDGSVITDQNPS